MPPQSATVGLGYTLSLANVFTDAETPNGLVLSVTWSARGAELQSAFNHLGHAFHEWGEHRNRHGHRSGQYECQHQFHHHGESGGWYPSSAHVAPSASPACRPSAARCSRPVSVG